jgi:hypothetical protein
LERISGSLFFPHLALLDAAMRENALPNLTLIVRLAALAGAVLIPTAAFAADFAPTGTVGTLTVKVEAVGGAKHKAGPGAGLDAREWKIKNSGQFTIRVRAIDPVPDDSPENQAKAAAAQGAYQKTVGDNDQAVMDKWAEKVDACNGNESCENRVRGQMMSDPNYMRIVQNMQGAAPVLMDKARAVDMSPTVQLWLDDPLNPSPPGGNLQLDLTEKTLGVVDTGGGGKVDVSCRSKGNVKIGANSDVRVGGTGVRINAKTSTYEIRIPADAFGAQIAESCSDSKSGSHGPSNNKKFVSLIGSSPPRGVKDFAQLLTFKGPIGSSRSPQMSGKKTLTTEWIDARHQDSIPVKVTIDWQFSAGGR